MILSSPASLLWIIINYLFVMQYRNTRPVKSWDMIILPFQLPALQIDTDNTYMSKLYVIM